MPNPTRHGGPGPSKCPQIADANVADVNSPFMPVPVPTWANALRNLDADCHRLKCQLGDVVNIGYKYPKPDIFLNSTHCALYTATWLAVCAHHAYTLATGTELPPPITTQQWHNFLLRIIPFLDAENIDYAADLEDTSSVLLPPEPATKGKQKKVGALSRKKHVKKLNSYLEDIPLGNTLIDQVVFYDTTIQLGTTQELEQALMPEVTQEILWELCHMNFRFELLSLNALLADTLYRNREGITDAAAARSSLEKLLNVFPMSGDVLRSFMIKEIPNRNLGLTLFDLEEWNRHLVALRALMWPWKGCPDSIKDASNIPIEAHVQALEESCASFYCQSFFNNFSCAPIIPCRLPPRSLTCLEPLPLLCCHVSLVVVLAIAT
ncbi:hypothetical protein K443DRAFT_12921 [Laccaria amethystina LaAM-08-1]|uniref:Uncharacterized protein n=1 Tax=Laccaria amethystina LaAM-08-1 TaxID=1095629 RepID=A0A0C9X6V5_9AGAR|nr:hypothetical protein K443DRAFT_12921 [Laccaria amethystina LaAM-08-1]